MIRIAIDHFHPLNGWNFSSVAPSSRTRAKSRNLSTPTVELDLLKRVKASDAASIKRALFHDLPSVEYLNHQHILTYGAIARKGWLWDYKLPSTSTAQFSVRRLILLWKRLNSLMKASQAATWPIDRRFQWHSASCLQHLASETVNHPWLQKAERLALNNRITCC